MFIPRPSEWFVGIWSGRGAVPRPVGMPRAFSGGALAPLGRLDTRSWLRRLLIAVAMIALIVAAALLVATIPPPPAPDVATPGSPSVNTPGVNAPSVDAPSVNTPDIDAPNVGSPSIDLPELPEGGNDSGGDSNTPRGPQVFKERLRMHFHEVSWDWRGAAWMILAGLLLVGLAAKARMPKTSARPRHLAAAVLAAALASIFLAGAINTPDSSKVLIRPQPWKTVSVKERDNGDTVIKLEKRSLHRHYPTTVNTPLLLIGIAGCVACFRQVRRGVRRLPKPTAVGGAV